MNHERRGESETGSLGRSLLPAASLTIVASTALVVTVSDHELRLLAAIALVLLVAVPFGVAMAGCALERRRSSKSPSRREDDDPSAD